MTPDQSAAEYERRINRVIDYIAGHLDETLTLSRLARVACFSEFHFHKLFRMQIGETVNEFIARMRVEKALFLMRHSPRRTLTDIALECGFNTAANFTRVFRKRMGVAPRAFDLERYWQDRKIGKDDAIESLYYCKRTLQADVSGFQVETRRLPDLDIAYLRVFRSYEEGRVQAAFRALEEWAGRRGLLTPEARWIGMSKDDPEIVPLVKCSYDVCLTVPRGTQAEGRVEVRRIPSSLYGVLGIRGDLDLADRGWHHLFKTWLPRSGFQPAPQASMEVFRKSPLLGWEEFDVEECLPVRSL